MKRLVDWIINLITEKPLLATPVVSSSCSVNIVWGNTLLDLKTGKEITHRVTSMYVDTFLSVVEINIQKGVEMNTIRITMEEAEAIGFINVKALGNYC